jgi:hypothetical protein
MAEQLLPVVKLFFPCEEAEYDPDAAAYRLLAPLHAIAMPPGVDARYECERLDCYAQLSDAIGTFRLAVEVLSGDADVVVYRSRPVAITFTPAARIAVFDVAFRLARVRFRTPGLYRLRLVCNHAALPDSEFWLRVLPGVAP